MNPAKTWDFAGPHETAVSRRTCFRGVRLRWGKLLPLVLLGWWCLAWPVGPAGAAAPAGQLPVAATILSLGNFCQKIGGDRVRVQMLIPARVQTDAR